MSVGRGVTRETSGCNRNCKNCTVFILKNVKYGRQLLLTNESI